MVSALKRSFFEKRFRFAVLHQGVPLACGGVAFFLRKMPHDGELIDPDGARLVDGSRPVESELMVCGTCGNPMLLGGKVIDMANIQEVQ